MGNTPWRRTASAFGIGAAVFVSSLAGPGVTPAHAGEPATDKTAGTASATATSYKINPTTASLSIGIGFGISLAAFTNQVAQAESRAIDLGIIGSTLAGEGCDGGDPTLPAEDQPQALRSDSREGAPPKKENEPTFPLITKSTQANATPYSEANTTTGEVNGAGSLVGVAGAHSRALTQLTKGTREAIASVDIQGVNIAGVVELAGLRWVANYRTGAVDATEGTFSIGSLKVLGQSLPTADPAEAINNANALLKELGVVLSVPRAHVEAGILFVDPMAVRIVPSRTRDSITGGLLGAVQPQRESLYDRLLAQDCGNATYITVSDIVIGSLTGAGSFSIELGGVQAKSEPLKTTNFLGGTQLADTTLGDTDLGGFDAFDSGNSLIPGPLPLTSTPTSEVLGSGGGGRGPSLAAVAKGSRGGKMVAVGLAGLAALLLFAERDRRLMRRAQRVFVEG